MFSPYATFFRPLLFLLPPEQAQKLGEGMLRQRIIWRSLSPLLRVANIRLQTELAGMRLPNPVGVAAGLDKDCRFLASLFDLGFGYVIGGTVTLHPWPGNPRPRLLRLPGQRSLVNAMGFPGRGAQKAVENLQKLEGRSKPVLISIAGLSIEEFLECHALLEPWADGVEVNISSPNTPGLRAFHDPSTFSGLIEALNQRRKKPLFVKVPPYTDESGKERVLELVRLCKKHGVDGITAINTRPIAEPRLKVGTGGLSGKAIFPEMTRIVGEIRKEVGPETVINACGGIFTAEDVFAALEAGANSVQLYTGLVYRGPGVARAINRSLVKLLEKKGIKSVAEVGRR